MGLLENCHFGPLALVAGFAIGQTQTQPEARQFLAQTLPSLADLSTVAVERDWVGLGGFRCAGGAGAGAAGCGVVGCDVAGCDSA